MLVKGKVAEIFVVEAGKKIPTLRKEREEWGTLKIAFNVSDLVAHQGWATRTKYLFQTRRLEFRVLGIQRIQCFKQYFAQNLAYRKSVGFEFFGRAGFLN